MAIRCGFFNSVNKDRLYPAEDMNEPYNGLVSNGVMATPQGTPSDHLQVFGDKQMVVTVKAGRGIFYDKWFISDSDIAITVEPNNNISPRIDSIIVRIDKRTSVRAGDIILLKGTPASQPSPPTINNIENVKDYRLANIRVNPGATTIGQGVISDRRGSSECPWVTSLVQQVDTSTLYAQWEEAYRKYYEKTEKEWNQYYDESSAEFNEWFQHIKDTLSTAALIRTFTSVYTTKTQDETVIPIGIDLYNKELDILNVFVNGLKLVVGLDYTINDHKKITLTLPLDKGQPVAFEVLKSVDGADAETVVNIVSELQEKTASLEKQHVETAKTLKTHGDDIARLGGQVNLLKRLHTIPKQQWAKNNSSGYYEHSITNEKITETSMVQINFRVESFEAAQNAEILGTTESSNGSVKLFAKSIPATDLVCDYMIMRGTEI